MTKEQALQALNEIYQVAFNSTQPGPVHARCQDLRNMLVGWISSQKEDPSKDQPKSDTDKSDKVNQKKTL